MLTLSEPQKKIVGAAATTISLVVMVGVVLWLGRLLLQFFTHFSGVFLPLAVAAILATLMKPLYDGVYDRFKSKVLALLVIVLVLAVPLGFGSYYFGKMLVGQISDLIRELPVWIEKTQAWAENKIPEIKAFLERHDLKERLRGFLQGRTDMLIGSAAAIGQGVVFTGTAVFRSAAGALGWLILPVYFIFMIQAPSITGKNLDSYLPFLRAETRQSVVYLTSEFVSILVAFFRGQLLIALSQGVLYGAGFAWVGLPHGLILGLTLGLLNIVPYLGNIIGLAVVIPLAWFHPVGGLSLLMGVAVVFVIVQLIESYVLTPRIMGKTTGLHPMAIIFAILFWGTAFNGILGMIFAIPLTAFLVVFWRLLKTRYIREWL